MVSNLTLTQFALLIGIVSGILFGLVPLVLGFKKQNVRLGIIGFVLTLIAGAFFSLLGAIPIAGIFAWLISKKPTANNAAETGSSPEN